MKRSTCQKKASRVQAAPCLPLSPQTLFHFEQSLALRTRTNGTIQRQKAKLGGGGFSKCQEPGFLAWNKLQASAQEYLVDVRHGTLRNVIANRPFEEPYVCSKTTPDHHCHMLQVILAPQTSTALAWVGHNMEVEGEGAGRHKLMRCCPAAGGGGYPASRPA
jgi:hypothetical protein